MDLSIKEFINRNSILIEKHGYQKVYEACLKYLLEESSIIMHMWENLEYNFLLNLVKILDI